MKSILFIALLTSTLFATEVHLKSFRHQYDFSYDPEFMINKDLGRAWVNVLEIDDSDNEDTWENDHFVKVEGLKLEGSNIVYNDTVCATVTTRGWRIFRHDVIRLTNKCYFETRKEVVSYDDGFYVRKKTMVRVFLVVDEL